MPPAQPTQPIATPVAPAPTPIAPPAVPPVQPPAPPVAPAAGDYDFASNQPPVPVPVPQPQQQPDIAALEKQVADLSAKIETQPAAPVAPTAPEQDWSPQNWQDVESRISDGVQTGINSYIEKNNETLNQQDQQSQQANVELDATINNLRTSGYLPPVTNQYDPNDAGKTAEKELLGYAAYMGTVDLPKAAQELASRHQMGQSFSYDANTGQGGWTQPQSQDSGYNFNNQDPSTFGSPAQTPQPPQPVSTQLPGAFAPVGSNSGTTGVPQAGPTMSQIRNSDYQGLVDQFNATQ